MRCAADGMARRAAPAPVPAASAAIRRRTPRRARFASAPLRPRRFSPARSLVDRVVHGAAEVPDGDDRPPLIRRQNQERIVEVRVAGHVRPVVPQGPAMAACRIRRPSSEARATPAASVAAPSVGRRRKTSNPTCSRRSRITSHRARSHAVPSAAGHEPRRRPAALHRTARASVTATAASAACHSGLTRPPSRSARGRRAIRSCAGRRAGPFASRSRDPARSSSAAAPCTPRRTAHRGVLSS